MADVDPIGNPEYTYVQAANAIAARIAAGEFSVRLPSERDLAREYGVACQTLRHGIKLLRTRGVVISRQGRGTFVAQPARPGSPPAPDYPVAARRRPGLAAPRCEPGRAAPGRPGRSGARCPLSWHRPPGQGTPRSRPAESAPLTGVRVPGRCRCQNWRVSVGGRDACRGRGAGAGSDLAGADSPG
ncbi:MAG TPA: GntR family transcriptional regulator [Streptosporangiaceae bacterium]|nr:GntR family transcriptional regulator [Streptosporangiaceae bacterium]